MAYTVGRCGEQDGPIMVTHGFPWPLEEGPLASGGEGEGPLAPGGRDETKGLVEGEAADGQGLWWRRL